MRFPHYGSLSVLVALAVTTAASAQFDSADVTGTGVVDIERPPNTMRMMIVVQSKAETTEKALKALNELIEEARASLQSAGANKESIVASEPSLASAENDQRQMM